MLPTLRRVVPGTSHPPDELATALSMALWITGVSEPPFFR